MQPYCGDSMHHAIMGGKEGHKAVGELWRDVFCLMVCPHILKTHWRPVHINQALVPVKKSFSHSYLVFFLVSLRIWQKTRAQGKTHLKTGLFCCTDKNAVILQFPLLTGCGQSLPCHIHVHVSRVHVSANAPLSQKEKKVYHHEVRWEHFHFKLKFVIAC